MQPEAQTTTRGSLAVSAGTLEIAKVIQGALEVFLFTYLYLLCFYGIGSLNIHNIIKKKQVTKV